MSTLTETEQYTEIDELIEGNGRWKDATEETLQHYIKEYSKWKCYKILYAIRAVISAKFTHADSKQLSYTYQIGEIHKFKEKNGLLKKQSTQFLLQQSNRFRIKGQDVIAAAFESAASRLSPRLPSHKEGDERAHTDAHFMLMRACLKSI